MNDTLGVQELQPVKSLRLSAKVPRMTEEMQYLATDCGNLRLAHHVEGDNVGQTASFHVLHDNPQFTLDKIALHKVHDVLVLAVSHDQNLVDDEVLLGLLLKVHLLDSNALVRATLKGGVDTAGGTLTDLVQIAISLGGVILGTDLVELGDNVAALYTLPGPLSRAWCGSCAGFLRRLRDGHWIRYGHRLLLC